MVLRLYRGLKLPVELVKAQITAQTLRAADLLGPRWSRIYISNKFPGNTGAAGQGPCS